MDYKYRLICTQLVGGLGDLERDIYRGFFCTTWGASIAFNLLNSELRALMVWNNFVVASRSAGKDEVRLKT